MPEYDKLFTYISLKNSQFFLDYEDEVNQIEVKTQNSDQSAKVANQIQAVLGDDFVVEDWSEFDANLFNAIKLEKVVMFLVLALMIIIASFNMTGNYLKLVSQKRQDIGILKSFGAKKKDVMKIFLFNGIFIYLIGTVTGFVASIGLLSAQIKWGIIHIPISGMPFQALPVKIEFFDLLLVALISLIITLLTTLIPARRTMNIDTIKVIQEAEE